MLSIVPWSRNGTYTNESIDRQVEEELGKLKKQGAEEELSAATTACSKEETEELDLEYEREKDFQKSSCALSVTH